MTIFTYISGCSFESKDGSPSEITFMGELCLASCLTTSHIESSADTRLRTAVGIHVPLHQAAVISEQQLRSSCIIVTKLLLHALAHQSTLSPVIKEDLSNTALPIPPAFSFPRSLFALVTPFRVPWLAN